MQTAVLIGRSEDLGAHIKRTCGDIPKESPDLFRGLFACYCFCICIFVIGISSLFFHVFCARCFPRIRTSCTSLRMWELNIQLLFYLLMMMWLSRHKNVCMGTSANVLRFSPNGNVVLITICPPHSSN